MIGQRRFAPCPLLRNDLNPSDKQACPPGFRSLQRVLTFFQNLQGCFTVQLSRCSGLLSERRRRDLNPRAAINDLHPFQGCPFGQLGYFSRNTFARIKPVFDCMVETHLYALDQAERMGFEPMRPCGQTVFKTASL